MISLPTSNLCQPGCIVIYDKRYLFKIKYKKILFTCKQAPSTLHSNVNKPCKFTYSTLNLEVHNGELTSLRGMGLTIFIPSIDISFEADK